MLKNFSQFLNENKESDDLSNAKELYRSSKEIRELLNDVGEGKFPHLQIVHTPSVSSYVGIAINDGNPVSEVYKTDNPEIALLAIIMKNIGNSDQEKIKNIVQIPQPYLDYSVFAGRKKMSPEEILAKYNVVTSDRKNSVSNLSSTPIMKTFGTGNY